MVVIIAALANDVTGNDSKYFDEFIADSLYEWLSRI